MCDPDLRLFVLDAMRLVDHQVSPVKLLKNGPLDDEHFVGSDAHVPLSRQQGVADESRLRAKEWRV